MMIIECINCNKKFEVDPNLIPEKGRSIQCGSCGYKWFHKKDLSELSSNTDNEINNQGDKHEITISNDNAEKLSAHKNEEKDLKEVSKEDKSDNKSNIFNKIISYLIVIIISFVALIIVLDTFKTPLSNIFPNLEIILFNLYETFEDVGLFLKDLIK